MCDPALGGGQFPSYTVGCNVLHAGTVALGLPVGRASAIQLKRRSRPEPVLPQEVLRQRKMQNRSLVSARCAAQASEGVSCGMYLPPLAARRFLGRCWLAFLLLYEVIETEIQLLFQLVGLHSELLRRRVTGMWSGKVCLGRIGEALSQTKVNGGEEVELR